MNIASLIVDLLYPSLCSYNLAYRSSLKGFFKFFLIFTVNIRVILACGSKQCNFKASTLLSTYKPYLACMLLVFSINYSIVVRCRIPISMFIVVGFYLKIFCVYFFCFIIGSFKCNTSYEESICNTVHILQIFFILHKVFVLLQGFYLIFLN